MNLYNQIIAINPNVKSIGLAKMSNHNGRRNISYEVRHDVYDCSPFVGAPGLAVLGLQSKHLNQGFVQNNNARREVGRMLVAKALEAGWEVSTISLKDWQKGVGYERKVMPSTNITGLMLSYAEKILKEPVQSGMMDAAAAICMLDIFCGEHSAGVYGVDDAAY